MAQAWELTQGSHQGREDAPLPREAAPRAAETKGQAPAAKSSSPALTLRGADEVKPQLGKYQCGSSEPTERNVGCVGCTMGCRGCNRVHGTLQSGRARKRSDPWVTTVGRTSPDNRMLSVACALPRADGLAPQLVE